MRKLSNNKNIYRILIPGIYLAIFILFVYNAIITIKPSLIGLSVVAFIVFLIHLKFVFFDWNLYVSKEGLILKRLYNNDIVYSYEDINNISVNYIPFISIRFKIYNVYINESRFNVRFKLYSKDILYYNKETITSNIENYIKTQIELMKD